MVWAQHPVVKGYWVILNINLYIKGTVTRDFRPFFWKDSTWAPYELAKMVSHIKSFEQKKNGQQSRETVPLRFQQKTKDISKHNLKLTLMGQCQK